jgi:hypothetical protein
MSSTETQRNEKQQEEKEEENNNAVLPQIGEDPGVPVEAIEEDSKQKADKDRHKQEKDRDLTDSKA